MTTAPRPTFSIVTVTLNCADDALRTARSLLEQSYTNYEYVVKDGGSSDGTPDRLRELGAPRVIVAPDSGVYGAMNQALEHCTGEYVCFMNAGDLFPGPDTLATVAEWAERHGRPDFLYGDLRSYVRHPFVAPGADNQPVAREISYPNRLSPFYLFRKMVCHQVWFVRRELYLARGGLNENYRLLADYDFLLGMLLEAKVRYGHVPAVTAVYQGDGLTERQKSRAEAEREQIQARWFSPGQRAIFGATYGLMRQAAHGSVARQIYGRLSSGMRRRFNGW